MNFFETISGCEVVSHQESYIEKNEKIPGYLRFVMQFLILCLGISGIACLIWCMVGSPATCDGIFFRVKMTLIYLVIALVAIGVLDHFAKAVKHPEQYILRFSDDLSAANLFKIQQEYDLKQGEEPNLWIAIPKQANRFMQ